MRIVDRDQRRTSRGDLRQQRQRGQADEERVRRRTGRPPERHVERLALGRRELGGAGKLSHEESVQPCEREPGLRLDPRDMEVAKIRSVADRGLQQRGLADAGLPADHHRTAQAFPGGDDELLEVGSLIGAAHQRELHLT